MALKKSDISKAIRELERFGAKVYNFQQNRKLHGNFKGFPDYVIIYRRSLYFLEMKLIKTKDNKLRPDQEAFAEIIKGVSLYNMFVYYHIINEQNYQDIIQKILQQENLISKTSI